MDWTADIGRALGRVLPARLLDHVCSQNCAYRSVFETSTSYQQPADQGLPSSTYFAPSKTVSLPDLGTYSRTVSIPTPYSVVDDLVWQTHESIRSNSATLSLLLALFFSALLIVAFFFAFRICRMWEEGEELVGLKARYDFKEPAGPACGDDDVRTQNDRMRNLRSRCDRQAVTIERVLVEKTRNEAVLVQTIRAMTQERASLEATVMHTALGTSLCFTTTTQNLLGELRQMKDDKAKSDSQARAASMANKQLEIENIALSSQVKDLQGRLQINREARARDAIKVRELDTKLLAENTRLQDQSDEVDEYKSKVTKLEDTIAGCEATITRCTTTIASQKSEIAEQQVFITKHEATAMRQGSTITDHENVIARQHNTIAEREATIIQHESTIADQEIDIARQQNILDFYKARVIQQQGTITDQESVMTSQRNTVAERDATITCRESTIADQESKNAEQRKIVEDSEATIAQQEATIANLNTMIVKKDIIIADHEAIITQQKTTIVDHETQIAKQAMITANLEATITELRTTSADQQTTIEWQKATINGHEERLEAQQLSIANHETTIHTERSRLKQIETCAGLASYAQFVVDASRKRMDAHGRSQRLAKVATDFERTARGFANDALRSSSGYLAARKERRHSVSAGSTRLEVASQLKGPAFTATSPDLRQRLTDKEQRDSERLTLTKNDLVITIDPDIACKESAPARRTFKGLYSIDAYNLAVRARHRPTALLAISLDDIRDDRVRWADTTKFNAGTYFVCKEIAARKAAQAILRGRTQSKFNHILETLAALGKFMKRHDLDKARGSGPSLVDRFEKLAGRIEDEKFTKLIDELEQCNEQIQRETGHKIEQMTRDLSKWLLDLQDTEVPAKQDNGNHETDQPQSRQSKKELGHVASTHDQEPKSERGTGSAITGAPNSGWSISSNTESVSSKDAGSDMATKQPLGEEPNQEDARAVQNQDKSRIHTVAEHEIFTDSQAEDSHPQLGGPQAKKKTRRNMKNAKNTTQPTQDIGTVGSGQQEIDIDVGCSTGLGASRFAQNAVDERPVVVPQAPAASGRSGLQASKYATSAVAAESVVNPQAPAAPVRSGLHASKFATSELGNTETLSNRQHR